MTSGGPTSGQMFMGQGQPIIGSGGGGAGGQQQMASGPTPMGTGYPQQTAPGPASMGLAGTSYQSQSVTVLSKGQTICKKCLKQPANPGRAWCQSCYINKS